MIVLSYIGVHQMFQLALAAHEIDSLEELYCSMIAAPGKWGAMLAGRVSAASVLPMGASQLPPDRVREIPWPLLARHMRRKIQPRRSSDYFRSNVAFDQAVARRLTSSRAKVFVGAETCALESLRAAGRKGMKRVLDCPGIPADFLAQQVAVAADDLKIKVTTAATSARMNARKSAEMSEADVLLFCSEFQRTCHAARGVPLEKMRVNPLWVDPAFANQPTPVPSEDGKPLRVLFVGHATVGKGGPYAIDAMEMLGARATLTICGGVDETVSRWAGGKMARHRVLGWRLRSDLPEIYRSHDVLLFPTLGDSFGFVALEAMACGLPVVTTTNAGVPLPDETWRSPVRDAEALAARLERYAENRTLLAADSARAQTFAREFTPERFRQRAQVTFRELLS